MPSAAIQGARLPRWLHPGAWWLWALGLATAASRTTNPILLGLILAVAAAVVAARKPEAPWARSFSVFLKFGVVIILLRMTFQLVLGEPQGTHVLFSLPQVPLPGWLAGIRLGGEVTAESLLYAAADGFRLAVLLACVGAANSLASPSRLLKTLPGALYEIGVAVVVALTFAPQLVADIGRVRTARRLRGRPDRGIRGAAGAAMPVFEGSLERAVALAAAMDSRGYGRSAQVPARVRHTTSALMLAGLIGVCGGLYGLLNSSGATRFGVPLLIIGLGLAVAGMWLGGRRSIRTRYRPDPWRWPEWVVSVSGMTAAAAVIVSGALNPASTALSATTLAWPQFPPLAVAGILLALLPAVAAPPLPPAVAPAPKPRSRSTDPELVS